MSAQATPALGDLTPAQLLGADRVLDPAGALPQAALRLDAETPARAHEAQVDVAWLNLDATSHRQLWEANGRDPERAAAAIAEIVAGRGKMHNPVTGSGGVLIGRVTAIGSAFPADGLAVGDTIVVLASLTTTPLRLTAVGAVDGASPQVPVEGTAVVTPRMPWARFPDDLPQSVALGALDVYSAASHTAALARPGDHVVLFGSGRAGALAGAAARDALGDDVRITALDASAAAVERAVAACGAEQGLVVDLTDAIAAMEALAAADLPPADLTVVCVNVPGCEASAALVTRDGGTALFFSMATSFTAAALGAEAFSSGAQLIVGNGYAPDRGEHALRLVRANAALARCFAE